MNTAVAITINDHAGGIVRDVDLALLHIARSLSLNPESENAGARMLESCETDYRFSGDGKNFAPSAIHALALYVSELDSYETLTLGIHNLDAEPGFETEIMSYDLADPKDASFLLHRALLRVQEGEMTVTEAASNLELEIEEMVGSHPFGLYALVLLERLQETQRLSDYPAEDPRNLIPEIESNADAEDFLKQLPYVASAVLWDLTKDYQEDETPAPSA